MIEIHVWKDGRTVTFRARVRAYGRQWRIAFGTNHEGWSEERARVEMDAILEKISGAPGNRRQRIATGATRATRSTRRRPCG